MKIVVADGYPMNPGDMDWQILAAMGELTVYDRSSDEEAVERFADAEIVIINKVYLGRKELDRLPRLRYIGLTSSGCDAVDLAAAAEKGICVTNVPGYSTMGVAQLTFAHILNIANRVALHGKNVSEGGWTSSADFSYTLTPQIELDGKILGLVGTGAIGQAVARIGKALGMKVIGCSRSGKAVDGIEITTFEDICRSADIISLHCPFTAENKDLLNRNTFALMKDGVWIINTARGGLINNSDLADALASGKVGGAGLDVMASEPPAANDPLLTVSNCFITPHLAWMTVEARRRLFAQVAENLSCWLAGNPINKVS